MHEKTIGGKTLYQGRILDLEVLDVELEDGKRSIREIVRHAGAVGVLPRLPDGRFVFVRQYRKAVDEEVVEVCAGLVDDGETAEAAARRELKEETGCRADRLVHLGVLYSSPGYTDEKVDAYFADCRPDGDGGLQLDSDERLERVVLTGEQVGSLIRENRIRDSKTIAVWLLYLDKIGRA